MVADTANTNLTYQDTGLQQATTYYYRVSTINPSGTSAISNESLTLTFGVPDSPTTLTATAEESVIIKLDWVGGADNGGAITGYKVNRKTVVTDNFTTVSTITDNTTRTYADDNVNESGKYWYRVLAYNNNGD